MYPQPTYWCRRTKEGVGGWLGGGGGALEHQYLQQKLGQYPPLWEHNNIEILRNVTHQSNNFELI